MWRHDADELSLSCILLQQCPALIRCKEEEEEEEEEVKIVEGVSIQFNWHHWDILSISYMTSLNLTKNKFKIMFKAYVKREKKS